MFVSHSHRFIVFPDPMGACPWIDDALMPWIDQDIPQSDIAVAGSFFYRDMSPVEAELAFDMSGLAFRTYTRIAIIRNPYAKMVQLYDQIAATDRLWRIRRRVGGQTPDFTRWLHSTRPNGWGAIASVGPRWRRFGAWSADNWCEDRINHIVRAETAEDELPQIFQKIGITPKFESRAIDRLKLNQPVASRYSAEADQLIRDRYDWDLHLYGEKADELRLVA